MSSTDIVEAIRQGDVTSVESYFDASPDELTALLGWRALWKGEAASYNGTALHCAAYYDQADIVRLLVQKGIAPDFNETVPGMWTPLHHAERNKSYHAAAALLDAGADPEVASAGGNVQDFCNSPAIEKLRDPMYLEKIRRQKIEGTWRITSPVEIAHDHELPDSRLKLTDVFNFGARFWRSVVRDEKRDLMTQSIVFFDDMPDKTLLQQAFQELRAQGGAADEDTISGQRALAGKPPLGKSVSLSSGRPHV